MDAHGGHRLHTATEHGREIYLREGCWYCHSQYVRPVTGETRRWGPVSRSPANSPIDVPHLFGTRRIGPDLMRVGLKYSDEWHLAHFWNPRQLSPDSIMGGLSGLFDVPAEPVKIVDDGAGGRTLEQNAGLPRALFDFAAEQQIKLTPNADGLLFVPMAARGKYAADPDAQRANITGDAVKIAAETEALEALIAYVQKLGMNRGKWRELFEPKRIEVVDVTMPRSDEWMPTARRSMSVTASAATGSRATATARRQPSCPSSARATSLRPYSSSG